MKKDDGGNVYAFASEWGENYGISRRDWLAGLAMQGILAHPEALERLKGSSGTVEEAERYLCVSAYSFADAMIEEGKEGCCE